jgi:benzoyl-CoA reductase/2-hydroxyglutaryl-CoA dehydratase subunit BcrC/BadD/HgdB
MEVYLTSPWVPAEWIKAHGLEPRGVWFAPDFLLESIPLAAGVCAFASAVVRLAETQAGSAVVFTTHCDQLRRGFDAVVRSAPGRVFLFNLPATWQTAAAERIFCAELERLGRFLLKLGGHLPATEELRRVMGDYACARAKMLEAGPWCPARRYAEAIARFHWDGSVDLPERDLSQRSRRGENTAPYPEGAVIPLAVVGGPLPRSHWGLLDTIESAGGRVVLNATETGERSLLPPFAPEPGAPPQTLLARGCLEGCVDVFQRPNTRLYAWLKERLAARHVRGLVLWQFVGCDLWRAEAQSLREAFGLPLLLLDADETASGSQRNAGRVEAFLEALR